MMKRLTVAALLATACLAAPAQQTRTLTADKHNEYGLVYSLPRTALCVEVTVSRTLEQAGPYWQYAKKYIGTDKVITEDAEQWQILNVRVTPCGVPDPDSKFLMQLKPGVLTFMSVADDNMLLAINKEVEAPAVTEADAPVLSDRIDMNEFLQYVNEDFISSRSSAKRAQMLAENLMEVRDAKVSLTRGTADSMPTDGRQLELMLASLARQERAFTSAFTGYSQTDTIVSTYTYIPGEANKAILFRMSDFAGPVEADDYSGDPVEITISDKVLAEMPVNEKGEEKKLPKDAVMYKIPGSARVTLSHDGRKLWSDVVELGQYGVNFGLNPSLFSDRRSRSYAVFDPATGALRELGEVNGAE